MYSYILYLYIHTCIHTYIHTYRVNPSVEFNLLVNADTY